MKVRIVRDLRIKNRHWSRHKERECRQMGLPCPEPKYVWVQAGHEIEHPQAWKLIYMGIAEPADAEAEAHTRANRFDGSKFEAARRSYQRTVLGIHPSDFSHYEAGLMNGYDSQGRPTLDGQRVTLPDDDDEEDEDE